VDVFFLGVAEGGLVMFGFSPVAGFSRYESLARFGILYGTWRLVIAVR
jgi:Ni/Fe-hydrogenase subunit HybB-like protein